MDVDSGVRTYYFSDVVLASCSPDLFRRDFLAWQAISWVVSRGGYEEHRSLVFLGIPPVASQATSCPPMFAFVR